MRFTTPLAILAALITSSVGAAQTEPYPSTYSPLPSETTLIIHATILTGTGERLDDASLLMSDGKIEFVGDGNVPQGVKTIDAGGRWVTPGLIDVHSHLGVYPSPGVKAHADGNEMTNPATPNVWAEHSVWPNDPGFSRALAGGVTTLQTLPGSGNLIGGRGVTLKNVYSTSYQGMKFPGAPHGLKMACGENPKRVYGERKQLPSTRMGNMAAYREQWISATKYVDELAAYEAKKANGDKDATAPKRDLKMETLAAVLSGDILVHMHCYRADEMLTILDMTDEFGYKVTAFHHGVDAYKVADELAANGELCGLTGGDSKWRPMMASRKTSQSWIALKAVVRSSTRIQLKVFNDSTRKPPRPWPAATVRE